MNKYPEYLQVGDKKYKIDTDFRIALKCNEISQDSNIGDNERLLAIIYLLLGDEGLADSKNHNKLYDLIIKYLNCNKEIEQSVKEPSMDFIQDESYIKASFMSDYGIDLNKVDMHWWQFIDLLGGLTEDCILNRVRMIREEPLSNKKGKELNKWMELKRSVALKKKVIKTEEQKEMDKRWEEMLKRKE